MSTVKFIQAQKFTLSGAGASIGDTTITLQSMVGIDGDLLVTANLGVKAFGTLEPGNGSQEEQISFTGITQNSNGTATLTGVKTVLFVSPYTETSGLAKTHAGATTMILSNDAGFYGQILDYIDTAIVSGGVPATNLVPGISKLSVAAVSAADPIVVGDNDSRIVYAGSVINTGLSYAVASGTASALTVTLASAVPTLASGTSINFLVPFTTASGVTLNINNLGAKTIKNNFVSTLASGEIPSGRIATVIYDGTFFQMQAPTPGQVIVNTYLTGAVWTKPSLIKCIDVEAWGGGGSGNSQGGSAAGGGGGAYVRRRIYASSLASSTVITVGAGGVAVTNTANGNVGNNTTFGSFLTAYGGGRATAGLGGGGGGALSAGSNGTGGGPNNGAATGADADFGGGGGANAANGGSSGWGGAGGAITNGTGGNSFMGGGGGGGNSGAGGTSVGGGNGGAAGATGVAGSVPGGGGGGASNNANPSGAGGNGQCIVTEFY